MSSRSMIVVAAVLWLASSPVFAQTATDAAGAPILANADNADADEECDGPRPDASKQNAKRKVFYVGPR